MLHTWRPLLLLCSCLYSITPLTAQISGTIYTTTKNGSVVNGNLFSSKSAVYLIGGPGPSCTGAGLPNGTYYFQVTDPAGGVLLSSDPITSRIVTVTNGVFAFPIVTHATGNGPCGAKTVQLIPFADTPNSGGEYKVWLTSIATYAPGTGTFGFRPKYSKTDNFKVKGPGKTVTQSIIRGYKFYDINENGVFNPAVPGEVPIPGWKIEIYKGVVFDDVTFTDADGRYTFIRDQDQSTYTIKEIAPPPGFIPAPGGLWLNITPTQGTVVTNVENVVGPSFGNLLFRLAPGVGRSKGFWHNEGRPLCAATDPVWRGALNGTATNPVSLRTSVSSADPNLSVFKVPALPTPFSTAFAAWANYIVGSGANGHAGYILSTQVAATILNNACGFMQGTVYIDRFQNGVLVSLKSMLTGAIGLLNEDGAGLTGPNDPYQDLRDRMLGCLNEFDTINNTGNASNPQVVYLSSSGPGEIIYP